MVSTTSLGAKPKILPAPAKISSPPIRTWSTSPTIRPTFDDVAITPPRSASGRLGRRARRGPLPGRRVASAGQLALQALLTAGHRPPVVRREHRPEQERQVPHQRLVGPHAPIIRGLDKRALG